MFFELCFPFLKISLKINDQFLRLVIIKIKTKICVLNRTKESRGYVLINDTRSKILTKRDKE